MVFADKDFVLIMENIFHATIAIAKVLRHTKLLPKAMKHDFHLAREAMSLLGIAYSKLTVARKTAWFKFVF